MAAPYKLFENEYYAKVPLEMVAYTSQIFCS